MNEETLIWMNIMIAACREELQRLQQAMDVHSEWLQRFLKGERQ